MLNMAEYNVADLEKLKIKKSDLLESDFLNVYRMNGDLKGTFKLQYLQDIESDELVRFKFELDALRGVFPTIEEFILEENLSDIPRLTNIEDAKQTVKDLVATTNPYFINLFNSQLQIFIMEYIIDNQLPFLKVDISDVRGLHIVSESFHLGFPKSGSYNVYAYSNTLNLDFKLWSNHENLSISEILNSHDERKLENHSAFLPKSGLKFSYPSFDLLKSRKSINKSLVFGENNSTEVFFEKFNSQKTRILEKTELFTECVPYYTKIEDEVSLTEKQCRINNKILELFNPPSKLVRNILNYNADLTTLQVCLGLEEAYFEGLKDKFQLFYQMIDELIYFEAE